MPFGSRYKNGGHHVTAKPYPQWQGWSSLAVETANHDLKIFIHEPQITDGIDALNRVNRVQRNRTHIMVKIHKWHVERLRTQVFELGRTPGKGKSNKEQSAKHPITTFFVEQPSSYLFPLDAMGLAAKFEDLFNALG